MYLGIGQRGNTIDKTVDILRKFRAEEGGNKQVSTESQRDRFRLSQLYGAGVKRIKDCRGRKQPKLKGDERDFEIQPDRVEEDCSNALAKLAASPLLSEVGVRDLAAIVTTSRVSVFDLIQLISANYRVHLSREETVALLVSWDCKTGPSHKPLVDLNKVLTKLYWLAEQGRIGIQKARVSDAEDQESRHQALIENKYTLNLGLDMPVDFPNDHPAVLKFKAGAGLMQLAAALKKINAAVQKVYHHNKKEFLSLTNATQDATNLGFGDGASGGGGGGISGGSLNVLNIRDYCRFNLGGLKLSIEEAIAVLIHLVPGAFEDDSRSHAFANTNGNRNAVPLDVWQKELRLCAVGVHSKLSPVEVEFDIQRKPTPAKDKAHHPVHVDAFDERGTHRAGKAATAAAAAAASPPRAPAPVVDEFRQEMLISDFKRINSPAKSMYAGILAPLGTENQNQQAQAQAFASPPRAGETSSRHLNEDVIIPIPEVLKRTRPKDAIPLEATRSYISAAAAGGSSHHSKAARPKPGVRAREEDDWENLDDDESHQGSIGDKAAYGNRARVKGAIGSSAASVGSHNSQSQSSGVYGNANSSIMSGGTSHSGQGSRFIKLGVDKPLKSVPIGKKFASGHHLNKGGNVAIRYNGHAHIRNTAANDGDDHSVDSQYSAQSEGERYVGDIPYQGSKPELYSKHFKYLSGNESVTKKKEQPADLDPDQKSELERLQDLALKRAAEEEAAMLAAANDQRRRRLKDQLDLLQHKAQTEFSAFAGSSVGVGAGEQERMRLLAGQNAQARAEEEEDARILKQKLESIQSQEEEDRKADRALLARLRSERKTIQNLQNQRAGIVSEAGDELSPSGHPDDENSVDSSTELADPINPHRPGSPLNPFKGKKGKITAGKVTSSDTISSSVVSDLASRGKSDVARIVSHVRRSQAANLDDSSVKNYSFHSLGSELSSVNGASKMSSTLQRELYVDNKTKQRHDLKFSHEDHRKEQHGRVVVVTRDAIVEALTKVPEVRRAQQREQSSSPPSLPSRTHGHSPSPPHAHTLDRDHRSVSPIVAADHHGGSHAHLHSSSESSAAHAKNAVHQRGWGPTSSSPASKPAETSNDAKKQTEAAAAAAAVAASAAQEREDQRLMAIYRQKILKKKKPVVPFVRRRPAADALEDSNESADD